LPLFLLIELIFENAITIKVSAESWTEDNVDFTLDPSGTLGGIMSPASAWDIHGSGYLNFAELAVNVVDNDKNWEESPVFIDAVIFFLTEKPDDLSEWQKNSIGAVGSDGSVHYCCTSTVLNEGGRVVCAENQIGTLIVNNDRDDILGVTHRMVQNSVGMEGVVSVDETKHMVIVFGYCDDAIDDLQVKAPAVRITGSVIWVSYVSGNTIPLYAVLALLATGLAVWYQRLMTKHIESRIRVEEWILRTLGLSAAALGLETIRIATEVYSDNEPFVLEFISDVTGSVASAASRCLYLVLALGLGVVTSRLSKRTNVLLGICLGGYVLGLSVIDAMDLVERGPFIAIIENIVFVMDVIFLVWIPCALCATMGYLKRNGEGLKLVRYRWILRIFWLAIFLSVAQIGGFFFDMIQTGGRNYDLETVRDGNEVIHLVVLFCIANLWRPNPSQQQYSYVLLEGENDEDECECECDNTTGINDLELTEVGNGEEEDPMQPPSNDSENHIAYGSCVS